MKTLSCAVVTLLCYVFPVYAQLVHPQCSAPPSTFRNVWYIDPVNGKTQAAGGNGSAAHPWNSLAALTTVVTGYSFPLLSTVPYVRNSSGAIVTGGPTTGRVHPGDEILLMSGNYGAILIGVYDEEISNSDFVTVAAAPGQTPVLTSLFIYSTEKWAFSGLKVQSLSPGLYSPALILIKDQGPSYPTSDIVFENMTLSSQDDVSGWTQAQWVANGRNGFFAQSSAGGVNTKCVAMTGSHISNVRFGATLAANLSLFSGNEIDHFGDDAIDYGATALSITKNYIHDNLNIGDGNHEDAMQGIIASLAPGVTVNNYEYVLIDSNTIIRQTDPHLQFPTYLQGIDAFDEEWTYVTVTNNVVITSACEGIAFSSIHGGTIANNTVVGDGLVPTSGNCLPAIVVGDKTHEGNSSNNTVVRNNLTSGISIDNLDPGIEADHNVALFNGGPAITWYVKGIAQYYGKPGIYGNANIIDLGGAASEFVNFDPSTLTYNMMLKAGAQAIGAGVVTSVPTFDILGVARTAPYDAGAYSYSE